MHSSLNILLAERCALLRQIYTVDPPCQQGCQSSDCPPAGGACICPSGQVYENIYGILDDNGKTMHIYECVSECPPQVVS